MSSLSWGHDHEKLTSGDALEVMEEALQGVKSILDIAEVRL